jgi:hypothetical protein
MGQERDRVRMKALKIPKQREKGNLESGSVWRIERGLTWKKFRQEKRDGE